MSFVEHVIMKHMQTCLVNNEFIAIQFHWVHAEQNIYQTQGKSDLLYQSFKPPNLMFTIVIFTYIK